MSRRQKMRDGNVSFRWNKWNYHLVLKISLLLIIFLGPAPVFICCLSILRKVISFSKMLSDRLACRQKANLKDL